MKIEKTKPQRRQPLGPATCSASRVLHLYVIDYEDQRGEHWHTVVEAYTQRGARWKFSRDNPDVTVLSCV